METSMKKSILIVDDEVGICSSLKFALNTEYIVYTANTKAQAIQAATEKLIDICLLDLRIGEDDGIDVLQAIKRISRKTIVIMMTAYGTIENTVHAMRAGAYNYLIKPLNITELNLALENACSYLKLHQKVEYLRSELENCVSRGGIIGKSSAMREVFHMVDKIKDIDSNILITGESGTGKELIAQEIHNSGKRGAFPFEAVNCAAIPEGLLEEELFGHKKGAFTGATDDRKGKFALANHGTIFLDEIAELPYSLQAKLLRVLQQKEYSPIGSNEKIRLDVRVLAATNRDLPACIRERTFREDLYFRLNVVEIRLPPLRERKQDIPLLIRYFIEKYNMDFNKNISHISEAAERCLLSYHYPGNVRQLSNILEHAAIMADGNEIELEDLPQEVRPECSGADRAGGREAEAPPISLKEAERLAIEDALRYNGGRRKQTAEMLGISEKGLFNKIKEYHIDVP